MLAADNLVLPYSCGHKSLSSKSESIFADITVVTAQLNTVTQIVVSTTQHSDTDSMAASHTLSVFFLCLGLIRSFKVRQTQY